MPRFEVPYWKTPEFRALKRTWDRKLAASGFRDLEVQDPKTGEPNGLLLGMAPGDLQRSLYEPGTERYFELARAHTHRVERRVARLRTQAGPFDVRTVRATRELTAWTVHAEGLPKTACAEHSGLTVGQVEGYLAKERARMYAAERRLERSEHPGDLGEQLEANR